MACECAVANAPTYEHAGSDVYAVSKGHQAGPWTVRNLLLEPQTSSEEGIGACTLLVEVDDVPGVLNEVTGVIARRGYNIQSLAVGNSEQPGRSRITIVLPGQAGNIHKLMKQLMKLIVVQDVVDVTDVPHVERELIMVKVRPTCVVSVFSLATRLSAKRRMSTVCMSLPCPYSTPPTC